MTNEDKIRTLEKNVIITSNKKGKLMEMYNTAICIWYDYMIIL